MTAGSRGSPWGTPPVDTGAASAGTERSLSREHAATSAPASPQASARSRSDPVATAVPPAPVPVVAAAAAASAASPDMDAAQALIMLQQVQEDSTAGLPAGAGPWGDGQLSAGQKRQRTLSPGAEQADNKRASTGSRSGASGLHAPYVGGSAAVASRSPSALMMDPAASQTGADVRLPAPAMQQHIGQSQPQPHVPSFPHSEAVLRSISAALQSSAQAPDWTAAATLQSGAPPLADSTRARLLALLNERPPVPGARPQAVSETGTHASLNTHRSSQPEGSRRMSVTGNRRFSSDGASYRAFPSVTLLCLLLPL